jgi:uncharacterized protein (TIGR02145 family)
MKTQNLLKSIFGVAVIAVLLSVISCDSANPSSLVGRWVGVSGDSKGDVVDLLSDGTGVLNKGSKGFAITWKTENGRFFATASGGAMSWSYKLQGSLLTFTEDDGKVSEYTKCNNDCKEAAKEYAEAAFKAAVAAVKKDSFTDSRDNKAYKTLKFGDKIWMAENLNYEAEGSKCYENQESNCQKYGRLYNWETAKTACPQGWHLSSNDEWNQLTNYVGDSYGTKLKATSGWNSDGNGTDDFGFAALPGGIGNYGGKFNYVGSYGYWWSTNNNALYARNMRYDGAYVNGDAIGYSDSELAVRCVKDN